ncbi:mercuric transporter MerT family protein [Sulfurospirillum sp. 1307]|jgi:TusA-related sulfurtransferase
MKLDCKNLVCPEPVLRVKKALDNSVRVEVELNSYASIENVKRFAKNQNIHVEEKSKSKEFSILILDKNADFKKSDKNFFLLFLGSIISAILASTCCLAPLLFLVFGVSMSSLSFLQIFAPYKIYFTIFAILFIGYLWFDYLKKRKTQLVCSTPLCRYYKTYLIIGTILVGILTTYPYWINYILE